MDALSKNIVNGCIYLIALVGGILCVSVLAQNSFMSWLTTMYKLELAPFVAGVSLAMLVSAAFAAMGLVSTLKLCAAVLMTGSIVTLLIGMSALDMIFQEGVGPNPGPGLLFMFVQPVALLFLAIVAWIGSTKFPEETTEFLSEEEEE